MGFDRFLAINFPIYYRGLTVKSRAIATFLFTLLWDAVTMYLLFFGVDIHEKVDFCTGGTSTSGVFGYYFAIVSMIIGIGVPYTSASLLAYTALHETEIGNLWPKPKKLSSNEPPPS
uniref:G-protein coupled receptors family 1 profile domain-containing protein n=1 Tax=Acrobeloides nanus TaxID=290746 RepID=A0A914D4H2_9BILA